MQNEDANPRLRYQLGTLLVALSRWSYLNDEETTRAKRPPSLLSTAHAPYAYTTVSTDFTMKTASTPPSAHAQDLESTLSQIHLAAARAAD